MAEDYQTVHAAHLRLTILRLLAKDGGGYGANDAMLADAVQRFGFTVARDRIKTELAWLDEQGLASVETMEHIAVAKLTARGLDVAEGRAVVPGVRKPSPRG